MRWLSVSLREFRVLRDGFAPGPVVVITGGPMLRAFIRKEVRRVFARVRGAVPCPGAHCITAEEAGQFLAALYAEPEKSKICSVGEAWRLCEASGPVGIKWPVEVPPWGQVATYRDRVDWLRHSIGYLPLEHSVVSPVGQGIAGAAVALEGPEDYIELLCFVVAGLLLGADVVVEDL